MWVGRMSKGNWGSAGAGFGDFVPGKEESRNRISVYSASAAFLALCGNHWILRRSEFAIPSLIASQHFFLEHIWERAPSCLNLATTHVYHSVLPWQATNFRTLKIRKLALQNVRIREIEKKEYFVKFKRLWVPVSVTIMIPIVPQLLLALIIMYTVVAKFYYH